MLCNVFANTVPAAMLPVVTGRGGTVGAAVVPPKKLSVQLPAVLVVPKGSEVVLAMVIPVSKPAWFVKNGNMMCVFVSASEQTPEAAPLKLIAVSENGLHGAWPGRTTRISPAKPMQALNTWPPALPTPTRSIAIAVAIPYPNFVSICTPIFFVSRTLCPRHLAEPDPANSDGESLKDDLATTD